MKHIPVIIDKDQLLDIATESVKAMIENDPRDSFYCSKWPEHVQCPKYNDDASIGFVGTDLRQVIVDYPEAKDYMFYGGCGRTVSQWLDWACS